MDGEPAGTPNPLNPAVNGGDGVKTTNMEEFSFAETKTTPNASETLAENSVLIDNVKPASFAEPAAMQTVSTNTPTTDTMPTQPMTDPIMKPRDVNSDNFVLKDSVVSDGKNKKKPFIIGAIIFIIIAIICGAAAIAIFVVGSNSNDRVAKAIEKVLTGKAPNIIEANGSINFTAPAGQTSQVTAYNLNFNGIFNVNSFENKVTAKVIGEVSGGDEVEVEINEITDKDGDTFFKLSGLGAILSKTTLEAATVNTALTDCVDGDTKCETEVEVMTNCDDGDPLTNCGSTQPDYPLGALSMYSGMFDAIDDQWILVSGDFSEEMGQLQIFDNSSACLVNAFRTLPQYGKNIASLYNSNQFITYSTDNLEISKKKDPLYRLGFNAEKLAAFINGLSNSGFVNELNACTDNLAINYNVNAGMIEQILNFLPTIYVEVDNNDNFSRVYFKADETATADLTLSYPAKLELTLPDSYVDMSTLLNNAMTDFLKTDS